MRTVARARPTHPAHAYTLICQLAGHFAKLRTHLPDDPLLAAPLILDRLPAIEGMTRELRRWAEAVNDCDPADTPPRGARLT